MALTLLLHQKLQLINHYILNVTKADVKSQMVTLIKCLNYCEHFMHSIL